MTISSTTNTVSYTGNGSTTAFAVPYVFFGTGTTSEVEVVEVVIATGAETVKTNGSDYTVSGGSGATGTVTAAVAPASTVKWVINRTTTQTQETDYVENDPFPAESHEEALDRLTAVDQEQQRALDRTAQLPDGYTGSFDPTLPTAITGSTVLAFNAGATAFEVGPSTAEISGAAAAAAAAAASATSADGSATDAAASATASDNSATAAAASETNAGTSETNAAASAASAANNANAEGTSTTSNLISVAAGKSFTTQTGKNFTPGIWLLITSDADPTNYMHGFSTAYSGTALTFTCTNIGGSGTFTDWTIRNSGTRGAIGDTGPTGATGQPQWQGAWVTSTAYALHDSVSELGSSYICLVAHTSGTFATDLAAVRWELIAQKGSDGLGSGDVTGPGSATDNTAVRFDSTTGKLIQASGVTIDDSNNVGAASLTLTTDLAVAHGGTGGSTAAAARSNLGAAALGSNSDITALTGLTTELSVAQGGTGASTHTSASVLIGAGASPITSVAPSTSGNLLTSNGSAWISAAPAGGGSMVLLLSGTLSTASELAIEGSSYINDDYVRYVLHYEQTAASTTTPFVTFRDESTGSYLSSLYYSAQSGRDGAGNAAGSSSYNTAYVDPDFAFFPTTFSGNIEMTFHSLRANDSFSSLAFHGGYAEDYYAKTSVAYGIGGVRNNVVVDGVKCTAAYGGSFTGRYWWYGLKGS